MYILYTSKFSDFWTLISLDFNKSLVPFGSFYRVTRLYMLKTLRYFGDTDGSISSSVTENFDFLLFREASSFLTQNYYKS